jgi:hypothetical protein
MEEIKKLSYPPPDKRKGGNGIETGIYERTYTGIGALKARAEAHESQHESFERRYEADLARTDQKIEALRSQFGDELRDVRREAIHTRKDFSEGVNELGKSFAVLQQTINALKDIS